MKRPEEKLEDHLGLFSSLSEQELAAAEERALHRFRSAPVPATTAPVAYEVVVRPMWRRRASLAAVAAAAIFVVVFMKTHGTDARAVVESGGGARKIEYGEVVQGTEGTGDTVVLSDKSRVEMRAGAELVLERANDGVRIRLNKGDIIVNAAKQHGHLYVQTKDVTVSVVGTVFFVNAEKEGSRVAVIEGEVRIKQGKTEKKLRPGEQVKTNPKMDTHSMPEEIAWSRRAPEHLLLLQRAIVLAALQNPPKERVAFEEVSIRQRDPAQVGGGGRGVGPSFECTNTFQSDPHRFAIGKTNVYTLIAMAYVPGGCLNSRELDMISGGPEWIRSDRYDIETVMPPGSSAYTRAQFWDGGGAEKLQMMIGTMLAERFKLSFHREMKERSVYVLDKTNDLKLKPWKEGQTRKDPDTGQEVGRGCGMRNLPDVNGQIASASVDCFNTPMAAFVNTLEFLTHRPVVDRTDMTGQFEFSIKFAHPDYNGSSPSGLPSLSTALRESLGLKLESTKAPVEILVVDRAERPSEN